MRIKPIKGMAVSNYMSSSVNKILGSRVNRPNIGISRDMRSKNMVHYGYYEAETEEGEVMPTYGMSRKQAKQSLVEKGVKIKDMKDITFADAQAKYGEVGLFKLRTENKKYKKKDEGM